MSLRIAIDDLQAFELLQTHEMTFAELRELKRIAGMTPAKVDEARPEFDPDAWLALLTVSYRRAVPNTDETFWLERQFDQILEGVVKAAQDALEEAEAEEKVEGKKKRPPPASTAAE